MFYLGLIAIMFGLHVPVGYWILYLVNIGLCSAYNLVVVNYVRKSEYYKSIASVIAASKMDNIKDIKKILSSPKFADNARIGFSLVMFIILINANEHIFSKIGYHHIPLIENGAIVLYSVSIISLIGFIVSVLISEPEEKPKK